MLRFAPFSIRVLLRLRVLAALFLLAAAMPLCAQPRRASAAPSPRRFATLDALMNQAVRSGNIPGGVLLIGHNGKIVYRKAFGWRSLEPTRERMTVGTIFDLASLTKCIATTTAVMQLVQQGRIRLNDPVARYLPEFAQNGKADITVRELMTHFSGLAPDLDLSQPWQGRAAAYNLVMQQTPQLPPGSRFVYSDINFETLGFLVEKLTGQSLADYTAQHIFAPLGMRHTRFLPPASWIPEIAPTQYDENGHMLRGVVHDPTARRMGGVAGHAGLFSTADDLGLFARALLNGSPILSRLMIEKMTTPQQPANASSLRGLGWDIDSPFSTNRGALLPVGSFGHTGFTGTSLWIDPVTDTYIILLTNRVHPHGGHSVVSLRSCIATAVVQALSLTISQREQMRWARITGYNESLMAERRLTARNGRVLAGIDVLELHHFRELHPDPAHPVRIGLVMNQTSVDAQSRRTADVLAHAPGLRLAAIFSPEHGVSGSLDTMHIANSRDAATGVPINSVYGVTDAQRRPTVAELASLDAIVFDIQDIGVRFYTYETTLGYFLEAAAKAHKPIYVLDRPNPINGVDVQGPIADAGRESFVSYWQTPVRHGMTLGELARMFNAERRIGAQLTVVPMQGWMRGDWFDSTGRLWVNPSPNMRSLTEAALYPGIGMIEGSNISVGRGTDTPFELVGAPWIDPVLLADALNERQIEGVRFVPTRFTPHSSVYAGQSCGGVSIVVTYRESIDAPELGLEIAAALYRLYPHDYKLDATDGLVRNKATLDALRAGEDPRRIEEDWQDAITHFQSVRAKYLLY
ncbi:MAG TPA: exo-beta-N-acetylmuramidase NamZ domain-containing protein [Terracidiphilus sp.]|nr:exo-beta-N-acetylmuramidase NamZ domain-containing protein [Terracidiphilus sp.]